MKRRFGSGPVSLLNQPRPEVSAMGGHILFALVIAGLSALLVWGVVPEVLDGQLIEPDNYMRLVRVKHLVETGNWYDNSIPMSNAPYGEVLHWTRPLDVLLLGATAPLLAFFPFPQALHLAGVFLPPLLLLFTCFAVAWASKPFAGRRLQFYAMITVLAQPGVVAYALPGRIDHHPLLILLFASSLGLAIRWILTPYSRCLAVCTGAVLGIGLWVGPEFLLPIMLVLVIGAGIWIVHGTDHARKNLWIVGGLLGAVIVAWLLEHPPTKLLAEEHDRLSVPHVLSSALAFVFWMMVVRIEASGTVKTRWRQGVRWRSSIAILGAVGASLTLLLLYPAFFQGPTADIDPRIWQLWRGLIEEGQAWVPPANLVDAGNLMAHLGSALFCIPFAAWTLARERRTLHWWSWAFLALALASYTGLSLFMIRHIPYAEILLVLVTVTLLSQALPMLDSVSHRFLKTAGRAGVAAALITGPLFLGLAMTAYGGQKGSEMREVSRVMADQCPLSSLVSFLSTDEELVEGPKTIVAHLDYGPEILYRTPHRVLGTLYHRNAEGILAVFAVLGGTDLGQIRDLAHARGVDMILVCPLQSWLYGAKAVEVGAEPSLHDQLLAGEEPDWLQRVSVPRELAGAFRLFRFTPSEK